MRKLLGLIFLMLLMLGGCRDKPIGIYPPVTAVRSARWALITTLDVYNPNSTPTKGYRFEVRPSNSNIQYTVEHLESFRLLSTIQKQPDGVTEIYLSEIPAKTNVEFRMESKLKNESRDGGQITLERVK